ncbi:MULTISPECIES: bifunctional 2-polyprenyl-6-hydroxyphenol methylase/3-demethylubiquinol 3-O-methyltransferase UbiG [Sphingomonas]|uniref:Ubiquinone biosynthesis O-methyltransferase n=1 Tax=Sphingomonas adhaesiva TaxID=28212 RepID=A0A2A4I610_9SPHN|nr:MULTISPECIES: bifunctional 2-polyprenyl-6-hydroxyphenol methylase/3-demethylubiquinol 3-O-methyltransferase UbiG [Sphingomonas]PCG13925.1 bifunctional 2-polyprenyl-6-hydroxyphenol methylase/3-demethylubiquinol 3-O-methyltransferase UbiG [Sphingomonas adhaesiva]PZU79156.1 MAG: bifunctional 2-polyprenyl-6-hydroxyphenol methylase/3-demethylubiquinol 3-O-methyltransferase UbiG [Sphingomonas sp.]
MTDASVTTATTPHPSIVAAEAAHFGKLAQEWWDPKGSSAMLHRLNPVRLRYLRGAIDRHWDLDDAGFTPLAGRRALDMGCGAGLLAEPLARMGAAVTAVDAAAESIAVARLHAEGRRLTVDYRVGGVEAVAGETFDLVTSMEVVEHVADPHAFVAALAASVAPGGLLVMSTPNRTWLSRFALVEAAERLGQVPRGTHDWDRFLAPDELTAMIADAGLEVIDVTGLTLGTKGFTLGGSTTLDYFVTARRN